MSTFDKKTLKNLQSLARIRLTSDEEEDLAEQLKKILDYVEQLEEVDTETVRPTVNVLNGMSKCSLREDEESATLSREAFLENAPDQIGGMIRVPPVMNEPS